MSSSRPTTSCLRDWPLEGNFRASGSISKGGKGEGRDRDGTLLRSKGMGIRSKRGYHGLLTDVVTCPPEGVDCRKMTENVIMSVS